MIDLGTVSSVHAVAGKVIVTIALIDAADKIKLDHGSIKFGEMQTAIKLSGLKWWPERQEVDLLFDDLEVVPEIGSPASFISSMQVDG